MKKLFHPHPTLVRACTLGLTYVLILTMLIIVATPQQYDLKVGEVAPITITATKDVQDARATQALVDAAMKEVPPSYVIDEAAEAPAEEITLEEAAEAAEAPAEEAPKKPARKKAVKAEAAAEPAPKKRAPRKKKETPAE